MILKNQTGELRHRQISSMTIRMDAQHIQLGTKKSGRCDQRNG